jgi:plasmid stabilization system protein ParE
MAKRKIIWSKLASNKLSEILEFYNQRNQNKKYSTKLAKLIIKNVRLLPDQPYLGLKTSLKPFRGLIIQEYIIFYDKFCELG